jgi:hypothetical protein
MSKGGDEDGNRSRLQYASGREKSGGYLRIQGKDILLLCSGVQAKICPESGEVLEKDQRIVSPRKT